MVSYHTTLGSVLTYGGNETRRPNLLLVHTYIYIPYPCPGHATEYSFLVYSFPFRDHPFKPSSANSSPLFAVVKLEGSIDDDSIDRCRSKYIHPLILWCEWTVPLGLCTFSKTCPYTDSQSRLARTITTRSWSSYGMEDRREPRRNADSISLIAHAKFGRRLKSFCSFSDKTESMVDHKSFINKDTSATISVPSAVTSTCNQGPQRGHGSVDTFATNATNSSKKAGLDSLKMLSSTGKTPSIPDTETSSSEPSTDGQSETVVVVSPQKAPSYPNVTDGHFRWCGHGRNWTALGIVASIFGSVLSIMSRESTRFVTLGDPIAIAPIYQDVTALGLVKFVICLSDTISSGGDCQVLRLSSDDINDAVFELARVLLTIAAVLGTILTACLLSSVYWESINLKPVGIGFLVVYFCQAFSMLFFDAQICHRHDCRMGAGGIICILASVCWIFVCLATVKMDLQKTRFRRRRRRRKKRREARAAAAAAAAADILSATIADEENATEGFNELDSGIAGVDG